MAESPSHKFGQIIGDTLEAVVLSILTDFAKQHNLYLDRKGHRPCRNEVKCSWKDLNGNVHDLDFVLERGGTPFKRGAPVAFIEVAWRRYTKHSRNKAQEIQGAIMPLAETYKHFAPFKGAILAGEFTEGAIQQLRSLGFTVLYFPYSSIVSAFQKASVNAQYYEDTPDSDLASRVEQCSCLADTELASVKKALLDINITRVQEFTIALANSVGRQVDRIVILPLHGSKQELTSVDSAIEMIQSYDEKTSAPDSFRRYEILIRFNNGNEINGKFNDKKAAIDFLAAYRIPASP